MAQLEQHWTVSPDASVESASPKRCSGFVMWLIDLWCETTTNHHATLACNSRGDSQSPDRSGRILASEDYPVAFCMRGQNKITSDPSGSGVEKLIAGN